MQENRCTWSYIRSIKQGMIAALSGVSRPVARSGCLVYMLVLTGPKRTRDQVPPCKKKKKQMKKNPNPNTRVAAHPLTPMLCHETRVEDRKTADTLPTTASSSPYREFVDRRQIMNAAAAAHAVAPRATYRLVRSAGGSSLLGKAVLGFVAASARATKSSLMLLHVTLT